jgi:hypothetical protein
MTVKLAPDKKLSREICMTVMDKGTRELVVTLGGDGYIVIRAKGMHREVVWSAAALYERGIREGRVR